MESNESSKALHILEIVDINNMVDELDGSHLDRIGASVVSEYEIDKISMEDWLERNELALKLIDMKPERKTDPWPGAAATKLPLVLNAAMKASAEEFSEILRGSDLVNAEIFGPVTEEKQARADRVVKRMNYQFYHELEDWEEDHDKLILAKNIVGTVHKKVFYGDGETQVALRRNGVVINDNIEKIKDAPRVTDEVDKYWWQAEEKFRSGEWSEIDLTGQDSVDFAESDKMNHFLEQIRREDLDQDGYPEPYIITVHKETKKVVKITPNFTPESIEFDTGGEDFNVDEYASLDDADKKKVHKFLDVVRIDTDKSRVKYVKYDMIPSWEGGYWGFGYGILLGPLNENCNTLINQILNQGHLQAKGGGFINSGIKMQGGELRFRSNEWKKVQSPGMDLSRNIVPLPVKEPSQVLFSLLGLLMDVLRELSSVTEVMSGEQPKANMAATSVLALIEQGKKLFNSVYKRHYRSLNKEFKALFDMDFLYQDPQDYIDLLDLQVKPEEAAGLVKQDFSRAGLDLIPTANPEFSSKLQRMAEAQSLLELRDDPRVNGAELLRMYIIAMMDDKEKAQLLVPEQPNITPAQQQEQMNQKMQEWLNENEMQTKQIEMQIQTIALEMKKMDAQVQGIKLPIDLQSKQLGVEKAGISVEGEKMSLEEQRLANEKARIAVQNERQKGVNERRASEQTQHI